jgi:putative endonuclease
MPANKVCGHFKLIINNMEKGYVYVLRSIKTARYYIGYCSKSVEERLEEHNAGKYENSFTRRDHPWEIFHVIVCESFEQARKLEHHIKKMKSRKYIENLKMKPEIENRLLQKYSATNS